LRLLSIYYQAPDVGARIGMLRRPFWTLQIDLRKDPETLFGQLHKTVRNEVRRAEKEGIRCETTQNAAAAVDFFNRFAVSRKLRTISLKRARSRGWFFTEASREGQLLAVHVYLLDRQRRIGRLLYSATAAEDVPDALAGFANKLLHSWDMLHLKGGGFDTYDLGGYAKDTDDPQLLGINRFKERLGGELVAFFHYYGLGTWLLMRLREVARRVAR